MQHIEQVIKDYIVKEFMYNESGKVLDNDLPIIQEGIVDSLGIFKLVGFIEEQFGIKIQPDDIVLENFETVRAIQGLVTTKLSSTP